MIKFHISNVDDQTLHTLKVNYLVWKKNVFAQMQKKNNY